MAPSPEWGKYPSLRVSLVRRPHYSPLKICFVIRHGVSVKTGSMIDFKEGRRGPDMSSPKGGSLHFTPSHTPANISSGQQVLRVSFLLNLPQATFAWERKKTHRFTTLSRCPPPCWFETPSHSSLYIGDAQTRQVKNAEIMQSPLIDPPSPVWAASSNPLRVPIEQKREGGQERYKDVTQNIRKYFI